MTSSLELSSAKKSLADVLGDSMLLYLQILKSWFRQKISRDDFDYEARKLLTSDSVHLHNQFLLAILTKCQTISSTILQKEPSTTSIHAPSSSPQKIKRIRDKDKKRSQCPRVTYHQRFIPANPLLQAPTLQPFMPESADQGASFVCREMLLPDVGLIHGRMIVTAWDYGLDDVDDDSVRLLLQAVELQLKNIITAVLCRRNGYHLREKRVRHGFGTECPPSFLQNSSLVDVDSMECESTSVSDKGLHMPSVRPSVETGLRNASIQIAAGTTQPPTKYKISLFDLRDALQIHKSCLPSHSVYSMAMEKITNNLHHPSSEEILQDDIHKQAVTLRKQLHAQQAVFR